VPARLVDVSSLGPRPGEVGENPHLEGSGATVLDDLACQPECLGCPLGLAAQLQHARGQVV
jgi:hypothetical protein